MKITTKAARKSIVKKVEEPKVVIKEEIKLPEYKIILPKEEEKEETLFSPEVEKLLAEDKEEIDE